MEKQTIKRRYLLRKNIGIKVDNLKKIVYN